MKIRAATIARTAIKLLFPAALIAIAVQVSGLSQPQPAPAAKAPKPRHMAAAVASRITAPTSSVAAASATTLVVRRVLDVPEPIRLGQWYWDDAGIPAGPIVITADIAAGTLSVFRGGYEIGTAAIVYGADDKPTPLGVFPIMQKDATHRSNLYDAPMPYMLRMTSDGVSIHGSEVVIGKGSNGCIGVPVPFAKLLFGQARLGDPVIVTNGRMIGLGGALGRG